MTPRLTSAPTFETERLAFRGHTRADFDACAAMWADPVVTRNIGGRPFTKEEVWTKLLRYVGHWAVLGYGYWVVRERATGRFVGEVGFADFQRDIVPSLEGKPEIGWVLATAAHGKGYATEAARAAIAWCEDHVGAPHTSCIIDPENLASIRVAEKCGYREMARATYKGGAAIVFER